MLANLNMSFILLYLVIENYKQKSPEVGRKYLIELLSCTSM